MSETSTSSTMSKTQPLWNVVLVGDYAVINTWVRALDDDAEVLGRNFLEDYYDLRSDSFSATAECLS
jgi:hypothetical protein